MQITSSLTLIKDAQATGEAFGPKNRTSSTSKHDIFFTFFYFCRSLLPSWIRIQQLKLTLIRIRNPVRNTDKLFHRVPRGWHFPGVPWGSGGSRRLAPGPPPQGSAHQQHSPLPSLPFLKVKNMLQTVFRFRDILVRDPDPWIRTLDLRIRILLFFVSDIKDANKK